MTMTPFTLFHTLISLVGIASGFVVVLGFLTSRRFNRWTVLFLSTTVATSVTGFFFPFRGFKPSYVVGGISLVVLAVAILARYRFELKGAWRTTYVVTTVFSFYLNFFVLIVQAFQKVPVLHSLAPTQSEGPFKAAQGAALILFVVAGVLSVRRFRVLPAVTSDEPNTSAPALSA
jgi:hypothetical protein